MTAQSEQSDRKDIIVQFIYSVKNVLQKVLHFVLQCGIIRLSNEGYNAI